MAKYMAMPQHMALSIMRDARVKFATWRRSKPIEAHLELMSAHHKLAIEYDKHRRWHNWRARVHAREALKLNAKVERVSGSYLSDEQKLALLEIVATRIFK